MSKPKIDNSVQGVRSNQNLSCNWTGTADFGRLVPFHWEELITGDKVVRCRPNIELQMLPLASPTFGKLDLYVHYFFVPTRLLWVDSFDFFTQTGENKDSIPPYITSNQLQNIYFNAEIDKRPLFKHWTSLGLPSFFAVDPSETITNKAISHLPFRAYNQIWWDFYRDPELIRDESKGRYLFTEGGNTPHNASDDINYYIPHIRTIQNSWISDLFANPGTVSPTDVFAIQELNPLPFGNGGYYSPDLVNDQANYLKDLNDYLPITESNGTFSESSRMIRLCETLTRLSERLSLSGKRQIEAFMARYGAKPNWLKMNMAQYLGGAKSSVLVSDITSSADTQTIAVDGQDTWRTGTPLGAKSATGYSRFNDLNIEYDVQEPGYLMGIFSVMPHVHFVQGLDKRWIRRTLTDFYQKSLEHVGNVAVAKDEIACTYRGTASAPQKTYDHASDNQIFAFRDPYYEYKVGRDILAGDFLYYHNDYSTRMDGSVEPSLQYMHSMEMYVDYPSNRFFDLDNLVVDGSKFNKIFYYLGGSVLEDVDDHFHLDIDKDVLINRPMDGFAIPTLETTEDPHASKTSLPSDSVL